MSLGFICDRSGSVLGKVQRTPAGGYKVPAVIARVGVLTYPSGREYTPPEVLKAAADSLANAPVTNLHPPANATPDGPLVTVDNAQTYRQGLVTSPVEFDGKQLRADLVIDSAELIAAIEGGRREVSLGYMREVEYKPGISPEGEPYEFVRTKISPNHVAIVDTARAGRTARLALDEAPRWQQPLAVTKPVKTEPAARVDSAPSSVDLKPWQTPLAHNK